MSEQQLTALLPGITASLATLISERDGLDEDSALRELYASRRYKSLAL